jgi:hypothetical protein
MRPLSSGFIRSGDLPMTFTPIKYIGKRPEYRDGTYGTRILFQQGETKLVPDDKATLMLKHPDVYVLGEATYKMDEPEIKESLSEDEDEIQNLRDSISTMNKDSLKEFAQTHYSVKLNGQKGEATLRQEVIGLVDQFGLK